MVVNEKRTDRQLLTCGEIADRYEVARDTVWEWIVKGVIGPSGAKVYLADFGARKIGGHFKMTVAQVEAFLDALNDRQPVATESTAETQRRANSAMKRARKALGKG